MHLVTKLQQSSSLLDCSLTKLYLICSSFMLPILTLVAGPLLRFRRCRRKNLSHGPGWQLLHPHRDKGPSLQMPAVHCTDCICVKSGPDLLIIQTLLHVLRYVHGWRWYSTSKAKERDRERDRRGLPSPFTPNGVLGTANKAKFKVLWILSCGLRWSVNYLINNAELDCLPLIRCFRVVWIEVLQ